MNGPESLRVLIRCDATATLGMGHLMRCDTLAQQLVSAGVQVSMLGPDSSYQGLLQASSYVEWTACPWRGDAVEARELAAQVSEHGYDLLIIDDYRAGSAFQRLLAGFGSRWLQFYAPTSEEIHADIAVCSNPSVSAEHFIGRVRRAECQLLAGLQYALLRQEFVRLPQPRLRAGVQRLLLTFGGGDDRGLIQRVLFDLNHPAVEGLATRVISGLNNPRNESNRRWLASTALPGVEYLVQPDNVAALLGWADLAIMAGGTTAYEAARCGLPMLLVSVADNQIAQSQAMQGLGCAHYLGGHEAIELGAFREHVLSLREAPDVLLAMSGSAVAAVDGRGCNRVVDAILSFLRRV